MSSIRKYGRYVWDNFTDEIKGSREAKKAPKVTRGNRRYSSIHAHNNKQSAYDEADGIRKDHGAGAFVKKIGGRYHVYVAPPKKSKKKRKRK